VASRYIIGIDLGTTNTAVAYVDTRSAEQRVAIFAVPQLVAPGELEPRRQLPSFVYLAGEHDLGEAETALPWDPGRRRVVGELARSQGARMPGRMISSAKSWLCHPGVDRNAAILPWGTGEDSEQATKLSPVAASAQVLAHIREAWDHEHENEAGSRFADQEVIVTVPASFDEAARELTLAAAARAGYPDIVLLEEPQAAFYAWIDSHGAGARSRSLHPGDHVLVFDIGGGTTDFTLIAVGEDGDSFSRTAVGDHLLLGGDNIDLTLARQVEARLTRDRKKLDALQWHGLVHACRLAKESLLESDELGSVPISVAGRGSKLIGGAMKDRIERDELVRTIDEGFFPLVERDEAPRRARGGLQEFGLPYAADPAVTRHLAVFLQRHPVARVDAVLFNGGAMTPASLRARVIEQIASWQEGAPRELANELPEMAVAKGAAYYGLVRRGLGARIRGGTARAFYIGAGVGAGAAARLKGAEMAVCLAAKGLEEGSAVELDRDFALVTNRPVSFKLFSSSSRDDRPGDIVPVGDGTPDITDERDSDLLELPPIVTVLRAPGRAQVTVHLQVRITELGALEIWCNETGAAAEPGHWRLSFDMRAGGAAPRADDVAELDPRIPEARALVKRAFQGKAEELARVMTDLEQLTGMRRDEWSMTLTRALFDAALEVEDARKRSANHEQRWLILTGFCMRPGTGAPLDHWRARQMWRIFNESLVHPKSEACRLAWWIVWRRIAGGLSSGQQEQLYDRLAQLFLPGQKQKKKWNEVKPTRQEAAEMLRTLANLERLSPGFKIRLGDEVMRRLESRKGREELLHFWALGRIGSRVPLYGPLNAVVPAQRVAEWVEALLAVDWPDPEKAAFPMAQLGRRTGDRSRDLPDEVRERLAARLRETPGGERTARLVEQVVALEAREERVALGDTLPAGLRLVTDEEAGGPDQGDQGDQADRSAQGEPG
jgi:molecular chaperone DnaK (HSP70)